MPLSVTLLTPPLAWISVVPVWSTLAHALQPKTVVTEPNPELNLTLPELSITALSVPPVLKSMTVEEIAKKDVPTNYKYKIVDGSEISSDSTFRNDWVIDDSELTDGAGENHGILEE